MITEQKLTETISILRFLKESIEDDYPAYDGVCVLIWELDAIAWVWGMLGEFPRERLVEFLHFVAKRGTKVIKATRDSSRRLPKGVLQPDGSTEVQVDFWLKRYPLDKVKNLEGT